ncbi:MAG TPA: alpha-hydroxy acid oxidase [Streptosporangiaceae bacterium]|nr:alpha-hydroxy acid oxidase [Streptosporangiaceae bacterium]
MNIREIRELIRMRPPEPDPVKRRLARCYDIGDLRRAARRLTPRPVFDYVDGGADEELSMAANLRAFRRWWFVPRALAGEPAPDTAARILDRPVPLPLGFAPTGYTRMMHPAGELAVAAVARRAGLPYTLSTMATTSIEDVAATGHDNLWFQLYIQKDPGLTRNFVDRAAACGYRALVVTVDTAVTGRRTRDERNGLVIPPQLTVGTVASIASRPAYWIRMLASPAITFANFTTARPGMTIEQTGTLFDPAIGWDHLAGLRERWAGPLLVKGPLGAADARHAVEAGADGVWLSNHGGRQLDRTVAPVDLLPAVREAVGDGTTVLIDSGIRHGADLAVAVALGADGGMVGRAYLYGLMAGGLPGVERALELLRSEFTRTLQLLGVTSVAELRKHGRELLTRG